MDSTNKFNNKTQILILSFSLALSQIVFFQRANYAYGELNNLIVSVGVLLSMSLGSLMALIPKLKNLNSDRLVSLTVLLFTISILGLIHFSQLYIWPILAFAGYGFYLSSIFRNQDLKQIVMGVGIGSGLAYILLNPIYILAQSHVLALLCVLPLTTLILSQNYKDKLFSVFFVLVIGLLQYFNLFEGRSYQEKTVLGFENAEKIIATHYSPLLLTDLIWSPKMQSYYIVTNGSRHSRVVTIRDIEQIQQKNIITPSVDAPYFLRKPKKVLIIGPAGGINIVTAMKSNVETIVAVDINPEVFKILNENLKVQTQNYYSNGKIKKIVDEGRHFLETTQDKFDLIVMQGVQTGTAQNILNAMVLESFLFTKEALRQALSRLAPNGILFIEEYQVFKSAQDVNTTLIKSIDMELQDYLKSGPNEIRSFAIEFPQSKLSPNYNNMKIMREAVIASPNPFTKLELESLKSGLADLEVKYNFVASDSENYVTSDNHPLFVKDQMLFAVKLLLLMSVFWLLLFVFLLNKFVSRSSSLSSCNLFFQGAAYTMFIISCVGPSSFLIGIPNISTSIVYSATFIFATIAGLVTLKKSISLKLSYIFLLMSYLTVGLIYLYCKAGILQNFSLMTRVIIVILLIGLISAAVEIPYINILKKYNSHDRLVMFVSGKLGVFWGALIGFSSIIYLGFAELFVISLSFYMLTFIIESGFKKNV